MQCGGDNEWRTHMFGATELHVAMGDCRIIVVSYMYIYNHRSLMGRLDFDFRHVRLVHAQGTKPYKAGAQRRFREEARNGALRFVLLLFHSLLLWF